MQRQLRISESDYYAWRNGTAILAIFRVAWARYNGLFLLIDRASLCAACKICTYELLGISEPYILAIEYLSWRCG